MDPRQSHHGNEMELKDYLEMLKANELRESVRDLGEQIAVNGGRMEGFTPSPNASPEILLEHDDGSRTSIARSKRVAGAPSAPSAEQAPFRLFDLPLEIREQIYAEALTCCELAMDVPAGEAFVEKEFLHDDEESKTETFVDHQTTTAILRANHQVFEEAHRVMLRSNTFVRIVALNHDDFSTFMSDAGVPILAQGSVARRFRSPAFKLTFTSWPGDGPTRHVLRDDFLVLASSLPMIFDLMGLMFRAARLESYGLEIQDCQRDQSNQKKLLQHLLPSQTEIRKIIAGNLTDTRSLGLGIAEDAFREGSDPNARIVKALESAEYLINLAKDHHDQGKFRRAATYFDIAQARLCGYTRYTSDVYRSEADQFSGVNEDSENFPWMVSLFFDTLRGIGATAWELARTRRDNPQACKWLVRNMKWYDQGSDALFITSPMRPSQAALMETCNRWMAANMLLTKLGVDDKAVMGRGAPSWEIGGEPEAS